MNQSYCLDCISASQTGLEDGSRVETETLFGEVNGVSAGGGTIMSMSAGSLGLSKSKRTLAEKDFAQYGFQA